MGMCVYYVFKPGVPVRHFVRPALARSWTTTMRALRQRMQRAVPLIAPISIRKSVCDRYRACIRSTVFNSGTPGETFDLSICDSERGPRRP